MSEQIHYDFRIDSWKPETLPMMRLAEYLSKLSAMFGYKEHVHFLKVRKGSAIPEIIVDYEVAPKVEARLRLVGTPEAPQELERANYEVNRMLRVDNASATLRIKRGASVLIFPGKKTPLVDEVIVHERGDLDGIVIRVGGKDDSVPVWIEGESKAVYKCQTNRELARQLATHLFDRPVRVSGNGQWCRTPERKWELEDFKINSFEVLDDSPLAEILNELRQLEGNLWNEMDDPQAELRKLRSE
ncbi:MAG: MFS transporter [Nitrosomonadales bacterium]|nr:MFS transporter [Nitrosomonadales bacterium]